jgi:hypothetical protein
MRLGEGDASSTAERTDSTLTIDVGVDSKILPMESTGIPR